MTIWRGVGGSGEVVDPLELSEFAAMLQQAQGYAAAAAEDAAEAAASAAAAAASEADAEAAAGLAFAWNHQTGTSYTMALTDASRGIAMDNASANTLTVPPNSSVAFPVGSSVLIYQEGAGLTTIAAGLGVTIRYRTGLTLNASGQYSVLSLVKRSTDEWVLGGDLELA